jgi:hypothetical protein
LGILFVLLTKRVVACKRVVRVFVFRRIMMATASVFLSSNFLRDLFNVASSILSSFFFLYQA